jgi:Tetratricopeptide repeat
MKPGRRLALRLALMAWPALVLNVGFGAPSSAQKNEVAALNAGIAELSRAGKYSQAIPLAQRLLANLEQAYGPSNRDVAAALNNLALLYGSQGRSAVAWMSTRSVTGMLRPATPGCSILRSPTSCMRRCWVRSSSW